MSDRKLETLFEKFRTHGDAGALGTVFDRTAPELLKVARHLMRDRAEAEDVLQDTYLAAIEHAPSFDARRPLMPWLLGILVKRAAYARRRLARSPDPARLDRTPPRGPLSEAEEAELEDAVGRALDRLPDHYREVVVAHLVEERRGVDIAQRLKRDPATVRQQLARGLARLRALLPRGVAGGLVWAITSRRSLATVRGRVLEQATLTSTAAVSGVGLAGGIVVKKVLAGVAVVSVVTLTATFLWPADENHETIQDMDAAAVSARGNEVALNADRALETNHEPIEPILEAVTTTHEPGVPASYIAALGRLTGRLVESDGRPVPDTPITLMQLLAGDLVTQFAEDDLVRNRLPELETGRTITDADGRFAFAGVEPTGLHALGIDLGGSRSSLRFVDRTLSSGRITDLGDVVLAPSIVAVGRVLDPSGEPVVGAIVRCAEMPLPFVAPILAQVHPDTRVLVRSLGRHQVVVMPPAIADLIRRLPVPTGVTDTDGRFRIEHAPRGLVTTVVTSDGLAPRVHGPTPTGNRDRFDVGDLAMDAGRRVLGTVKDPAGRPVPGAEVLVGASAGVPDVAMLRPCANTSADGRFLATGIPLQGTRFVAVRARPLDDWRVVELAHDEVTVTLPRPASLTLRVVGPANAAVADASVLISPGGDDDIAAFGTRHFHEPTGLVSGAVPGTFELPDLTTGLYLVNVRAPGFVSNTEEVEVVDSAKATIHLARAVPRSWRVVDDETGAPVEHARVLAQPPGNSPMQSTRSDTDGAVTFDSIPGDFVRLRVEHPDYVTWEELQDLDHANDELRLTQGGALRGRIVAGAGVLNEPMMVLVWPSSPARDDPPPVTIPDARGEFQLERLPVGPCKVQLMPRVLSGDPVQGLAAFLPLLDNPLKELRTEIVTGETTEVVFDFAGQSNASVAGIVRRGDAPAPGLVIAVRANDETHATRTDAQGRFTLDGMPAGQASVGVLQADANPDDYLVNDALYFAFHDLVPDEQTWLELDVAAMRPQLRILREATRTAVVGTSVQVSVSIPGTPQILMPRPARVTDDRGMIDIEIRSPGTYQVSVHAEGASGSRTFEVPAGGLRRPVDVLLSGVACRGTFLVVGTRPSGKVTLILESERGSVHSASFSDSEGRIDFEFTAMSPGSWEARLHGRGYRSKPIPVHVPDSGSRDLYLEFQSQE